MSEGVSELSTTTESNKKSKYNLGHKDIDAPLTADQIVRKWQIDKAKKEQRYKSERKRQKRLHLSKFRAKFNGLEAAIKKRYVQSTSKSDKELETGGGGVRPQKRGNGKYCYRQVNRKSKGGRYVEYIAKDHTDYQQKLWEEARRQIYKERSLLAAEEGLSKSEVETLYVLFEDWDFIIWNNTKWHNRKCHYCSLILSHAARLKLGMDKVLKRHFIGGEIPLQDIKKMLKSLRRIFIERGIIAAKASVKVIQNGESTKPYIPVMIVGEGVDGTLELVQLPANVGTEIETEHKSRISKR